jgi:hypothetical protein
MRPEPSSRELARFAESLHALSERPSAVNVARYLRASEAIERPQREVTERRAVQARR